MAPWVYDPHSGGSKIPSALYETICKQAESYASTRPWHSQTQLKLRFKSQFCYIDTIEQGDERVFPLCRLRYLNTGDWSLALFTYSNERYEPCLFSDGTWEGPLESALKLCESFIL